MDIVKVTLPKIVFAGTVVPVNVDVIRRNTGLSEVEIELLPSSDYVAASGTTKITLAPGVNRYTFAVRVIGEPSTVSFETRAIVKRSGESLGARAEVNITSRRGLSIQSSKPLTQSIGAGKSVVLPVHKASAISSQSFSSPVKARSANRSQDGRKRTLRLRTRP